MAEPTLPAPITRFLNRYPALRAGVLQVLERAEVVRAARVAAFGGAVATAPLPGASLAGVAEALATFERRAGSGQAGSEHGGESLAAAARALANEVLALRVASHRAREPRTTTGPAARQALSQALALFRRAYSDLEGAARAAGARRLPWQIEASPLADPAAPAGSLTLAGNDLPDLAVSRRPWGERCWLTGAEYQSESRSAPVTRHRSLDSVTTLSPSSYQLVVRARAALRAATVAPSHPAARTLQRALPFLFEEFVGEPASPTFLRLGLLDFPALAVSLNNMLLTYAERPLFGRRGAGERRGLGADDTFAALVEEGRPASAARYGWVSYGRVRADALRLAHCLDGLGLSPGERVGILFGENRSEFYVAEFACVFARAVSVGLQRTLPDEHLAQVLERARPKVLVCDREGAERLLRPALRAAAAGIAWRIVADPVGGEESRTIALARALEEPPGFASWASASGVSPATGLVYDDGEGDRTAAARGLLRDHDDDLYTIVYTSGSTGVPKGTMITRRRWAEEMCADANLWPYVGVSFQPQAMAADRVAVWVAVYNGGRIGLARRGGDLFEDARAIRPTMFDVPPVVWNTLYAEYKQAIARDDLTLAEAAAVRRRFRSYLGGRLAVIATGGAPSDPGVRRAMETIFGVPMTEGYGTTETGYIARNGYLLPGVSFRLVDRRDLGFTQDDQPHPRGELAVKTERTTARYFADDATSSENFTDDGFFLTGDLVELLPDRRCRIVGRSKQMIKLAGAEFVVPEELERHYARSELVANLLIVAPGSESQVAAVVVAASPALDEATILGELRSIAARAGLRACEVPIGVVVVAPAADDGRLPWTIENGLLLPSYKLNRRALAAHYQDAVDALYRRARSAGAAARGPSSPADAAAPGDLEQRLRRVAAAVLALEPSSLDLDRSFAEHGGGSLQAMELALRIEEVFGGKAAFAAAAPDDLAATPLRALLPLFAARAMGAGGESGADRAAAASGGETRRKTAVATTVPAAAPRAPAAPAGAIASPGRSAVAWANEDASWVPAPAGALAASVSRHVLLTGATGFLGSHLCLELARRQPAGAQVVALVRAQSDGAARARLAERLARTGLAVPAIGTPEAGADPRGARTSTGGAPIVALAGSLEEPGFGLAPERYHRLAREIGTIVHCAASVAFDAGYLELRDANVRGTYHVLELAHRETRKALHFVSSLNVALLATQASGQRTFEESPLPGELSPSLFERQLGYAVTKWVGERMIETLAAQQGGDWPVSISRPALISWSRANGFANDEDWLTFLLRACCMTRSVPEREEVGVAAWITETTTSTRGLDLVPVDFTAAAVAELALRTAAGSLPPPTRPGPAHVPTFHVANDAPRELGLVTLSRLFDLLALAALRAPAPAGPSQQVPGLERVTASEWLSRVEMQGTPIGPVLAQLRAMRAAMPRTEAARARAALGDALVCPPIDEELVGRLYGRLAGSLG